jgi:hypothetical protein
VDRVGMAGLMLPSRLASGNLDRGDAHPHGAFGRAHIVVEMFARLLEIALRRTRCATRALVLISSAENMSRFLLDEGRNYLDGDCRCKIDRSGVKLAR